VNNHNIPSTHAEKKITIHSHKHFFTPYPSLSPYSQTDGITDGETNTLAARGLEELFSSCAVVSVLWFLAGNSFRCYLLTYLQSTIQLWHCVSFWFWQEKAFSVTYVLSVQYTCAVVSVFWLWWEIVLWQEIVLKIRTPFDFL
jgi:hypothetical protein